MKKNKKIRIPMLIIVCVMITIGTKSVYAEQLTEEQVREQIEQLMESEVNANVDGDFAVSSYEIEKLYESEPLTYVIHDYRAGMTVTQMLENEKESDNIRYWKLPFDNQTEGNCVAVFFEKDGKIELLNVKHSKTLEYDRKLQEGKFNEIPMDEIEEVRYLDMGSYSMDATYVRLKDGKEYIIPYMSRFTLEWTEMENEKLYDIDFFVERLYNYYDEPTKEEIAEQMQAGNLDIGLEIPKRKVPLDQMNHANQEKMEKVLPMVCGVLGIGGILIMLYFAIKGRKDKNVKL